MKRIYSALAVVCASSLAQAEIPETHTVVEGDTLSGLIDHYGYPAQGWLEKEPWLDQFDELNQQRYIRGDRDRLLPGTELLLPRPPAPPEPEPVVELVAEPEPEPAPEPPPEPEIGQIRLDNGVAVIESDDRPRREVRDEAALYRGDVINLEQGKAVLTMVDEARFEMGPRTRLAIEDYRYTPQQPEQNRSLVRFISGVVKSITGLLGKQTPENYQLKTAVATIGIRGTAFVTRYCEIDCGELQGMSVAVTQGKVAASSPQGEVELKQNEFVQVAASGELSEVRDIPEGFLLLETDPSSIETEESWWQRLVREVRTYVEEF